MRGVSRGLEEKLQRVMSVFWSHGISWCLMHCTASIHLILNLCVTASIFFLRKKNLGILKKKKKEYSRPSGTNTNRKKITMQWWDVGVKYLQKVRHFIFFSFFMTVVNSTIYIQKLFSYISTLDLLSNLISSFVWLDMKNLYCLYILRVEVIRDVHLYFQFTVTLQT